MISAPLIALALSLTLTLIGRHREKKNRKNAHLVISSLLDGIRHRKADRVKVYAPTIEEAERIINEHTPNPG